MSISAGGAANGVDATTLDVLLEATRALLWIKTPADAKNMAADVVIALGGVVAPASTAERDSLPVDLSFGDGEPVLPWAAPGSSARTLLERHLPALVGDIHRAVELGSERGRLTEDATIDSLTGLPNRRMLGRSLGRLQRGEVVIMIDIDHFKQVNDTLGHSSGDGVLRAFGRAISANLRERDRAGRYGGEEFVIILAAGSDAESFLDRLRQAWEAVRPQPVTFSAGIALAGTVTTGVVQAADRAMYEAKAGGRDQWVWATGDDVAAGQPSGAPDETARAQPAFVAFSELEVPEGGQDRIEAAFRDRLGAVDSWPGFRSLEVWADLSEPEAYTMVSWWDSAEAFRDYMQSDDHHRSHQRIPGGEGRPRPRKFRRYRIVAR